MHRTKKDKVIHALNTGQSGTASPNGYQRICEISPIVVISSPAAEREYGGEVYDFEDDEMSKYAYSGAGQVTETKKVPQKSLAQRK